MFICTGIAEEFGGKDVINCEDYAIAQALAKVTRILFELRDLVENHLHLLMRTVIINKTFTEDLP